MRIRYMFFIKNKGSNKTIDALIKTRLEIKREKC